MHFGPREALFILLLLAMPVAAYFYVFQPREAEIAEARAEIAVKHAKLEELAKATKDPDELEAEIARMQEALAHVEEKLPPKRDFDIILRDITRIAADNKLVTSSLHADKIVPSAQYDKQPIKLKLVGDFTGFYMFLLEIEKLPRITRTSKLKIHRSKTEEGLMQADMVLNIYFKGDKSQSSASAG